MQDENIPVRLIYLIGSNHTYQLGVRPWGDISENAISEYRGFLLETIKRYAIVGIAEKMNVSALKIHRVEGDSVAFDLAAELNIAHRYCEEERGIQEARTNKKPHTQREQYWIGQLETFNAFPAIFLLGSDHIGSFTNLLNKSGFQSVVLADDWKHSSCNDC
jgi:hypothetical protein